jgi:hypothetical protein
MIEIQRQKMPNNEKCLFFCIFNISKLKMHGLKSNLIYRPIVYKKEITQAGYQVMKHLAQCTSTTTYDQICHGFSLLLPHISVALSTKAKTIFRGTFFVAISTNQVFVETAMK